MLPEIGVVGSHPDFQKEGPWVDWVMVSIRSSNGKRRQPVPAEVYGFVTCINGARVGPKGGKDDPKAIVWLCRHNRNDNHQFESQLLDRYCKLCRKTGKPKMQLMPVSDTTSSVLVFEDTPYLLDSKEQWKSLMDDSKRNMNLHGGRGAVMHDGVNTVPCRWNTSGQSKVDADVLGEDWAHAAKDIVSWKDMFANATN